MKINFKTILKCKAVIVVALISFLFFSCKDEHPVIENCFDGIQNQNETGVDCGGICMKCKLDPKMIAKINGSTWSADTGNLAVSYNPNAPLLTITGRTKSTIYPTMTLGYSGSIAVGTYPLSNSTTFTKSFTSQVALINSGTIKFTEVRNGLIKGTFSFTCTEMGGGATTSITDGVFQDLDYQN